jgi:hypothetical protein
MQQYLAQWSIWEIFTQKQADRQGIDLAIYSVPTLLIKTQASKDSSIRAFPYLVELTD